MNSKVTIAVAGVLILIILGYLASQVGNIGIRRVQTLDAGLTFSVSEPVVPGVPTLLHWNVPDATSKRVVLFSARSAGEDALIGKASITNGTAEIEVPCYIEGNTVSIIMADASTDQVLHSQQVQVLPAGPDCLH